MATIVTFPRPGYEKPDITSLEADIPGLSERLVMLDEPFIGISSTAIRRKIASGESIRYMVPETVRQYIADNRLYGSL
jgi:nicotinate-nucleotide adenylyltransferase